MISQFPHSLKPFLHSEHLGASSVEAKCKRVKVVFYKISELCRVNCFILLMKPKQLGPCALRLGGQNSTEAILACQWLGWVAVSSELCCMNTGPIGWNVCSEWMCTAVVSEFNFPEDKLCLQVLAHCVLVCLRCPETLYISREHANFLFSVFRVVQGEAKHPK